MLHLLFLKAEKNENKLGFVGNFVKGSLKHSLHESLPHHLKKFLRTIYLFVLILRYHCLKLTLFFLLKDEVVFSEEVLNSIVVTIKCQSQLRISNKIGPWSTSQVVHTSIGWWFGNLLLWRIASVVEFSMRVDNPEDSLSLSYLLIPNTISGGVGCSPRKFPHHPPIFLLSCSSTLLRRLLSSHTPSSRK